MLAVLTSIRDDRRRFWLAVGVITVGALAVRLVFTLTVAADLPLRSDPRSYHFLGLNLADGLGFVRPPQDAPGAPLVPTAQFPPLFPALLGLASWLGARTPTTQALASCFVGAGTVTLVALVGRRFADNLVGVGAALLAAIHPLFFQVSGTLQSEALYLFFVSAVLLAALCARDDAGTWWRWAVLGAMVGLAILTRTEALLFVPVLTVPLALIKGGPDARARIVAAVLVVAATVVVLAPWAVRNTIEFDRVLLSNNGGTVALGANCDETYDGENLGSWEFGCIASDVAEHPGRNQIRPDGPTEADVYSRWQRLGTAYASDHLGELPKVVGARLLRTWGLYWDPDDQISFDVDEGREHTAQTVGYWLALALLPFAIGGTVLSYRRRRAVGVLLAPLLVATITTVVGFGSTRMRVVAEPSLAVLAVCGIGWVVSRVGQGLRNRNTQFQDTTSRSPGTLVTNDAQGQ